MKKVVVLIIGLIYFGILNAQTQNRDSVVWKEILNEKGDTIPHFLIKPIIVSPRKTVQSPKQVRQYWRLAIKVKKVYPYAQKAAELLKEVDVRYRATDDPKKRKKYLGEVEKQLMKEYGPQIKKLSLSEGRILIKLIDRETTNTSYALIKDFKGGLVATFWQGVARVFGNNLKDKYDPLGEDHMIEEVIFFIETGVL